MPDTPRGSAAGRSPLDDVDPLPDEQPARALADDLHELTAIWPELWTIPFGGLARELVKRGWTKPIESWQHHAWDESHERRAECGQQWPCDIAKAVSFGLGMGRMIERHTHA